MKNNKQKQAEKPVEEPLEELKEEQVLDLLNKEMKFKYGKGSFIRFKIEQKLGEKEKRYSCTGYCPVGKPVEFERIVQDPPEWQNLTDEQYEEVKAMFDDCLTIGMSYIDRPTWENSPTRTFRNQLTKQ
jgi:hypothetical protein